MRARTIKDCERDVKGIHEWEVVCDNDYVILLWCARCGAVGEVAGDDWGNPIPRHKVVIKRRVQE